MEASGLQMSDYFQEKLAKDVAAQKRYVEKINICKIPKDPYTYKATEIPSI